jgi:hypothetical protein
MARRSAKATSSAAAPLTGICNDVKNPLMGSNGTPFARNVEFDTAFPELGLNELTQNRHGGRLSLLQPDPQVISRVLFTRAQSTPTPAKPASDCPTTPPTPTATTRKLPSSTSSPPIGSSS